MAEGQPGIRAQSARPLQAAWPVSGFRDSAAGAPSQAIFSPEGSQRAGEGPRREEGAPRLQSGGEPLDIVPDSESEDEGCNSGSPAANADSLAGQQPLIAVKQEQHAKVWILNPAATLWCSPLLLQWGTGLQCTAAFGLACQQAFSAGLVCTDPLRPGIV